MKPFVKWVGGKRQLLPEIEMMLPVSYNTYYEPFVGGGALLFDIAPEKAVIGDMNATLIGVYKSIRDNKEALIQMLDTLTASNESSQDKKAFYNQMREKYNNEVLKNPDSLEVCALFMYLNKTCFNGLYRVNSKGLFNVPFNGKEKLHIYEAENLDMISKYLENVLILNTDFEETCKTVSAGDFVFFDSPYAPLKPDSFEAYTKEGFSLDDHKRLARVFHELTEKGVYCMLTNHNTELINELYKGYNKKTIQVKRMINSDASKRTGKEIIITNYPVDVAITSAFFVWGKFRDNERCSETIGRTTKKELLN